MSRSFRSWIAVVTLVALAAAGGFWAGSIATKPIHVPPETPDKELYSTVKTITVGKTLSYNVTVKRLSVKVFSNELAGIITRVAAGSTFKVGDPLYWVNNIPVRAVKGNTPFYRPLQLNLSGPDVMQLNQALIDLGYLKAPVGNKFDRYTESALRAWQKDFGGEQTGVVSLGELAAIPNLPCALTLDAKLTVSSRLTGSEPAIFSLSDEPSFALVLSPEQARLVPTSATVNVKFKDKVWSAVIADSSTDEQQRSILNLTSREGKQVCGGECALLPAAEQQYLLSEIQIVPPVTGPGVPVSAISTDAQQVPSVIVVENETRTTRQIKILGSQNGMAVVEGVHEGEKVQTLVTISPAQLPGKSGGSTTQNAATISQTMPVRPSETSTQK